MKNKNNTHTILVATTLSVLLHSPISWGSVTSDMNARMTKLLGHAPAVMSIKDAQNQRLDRAETEFQPWSGSYWPDINGGINNHYRDHWVFDAKVNFIARYKLAHNRVLHDHEQVVKKMHKWDNEKLNEKLSPAEKYDLLLGDLDFTFTNAVTEESDFRSKYRLTTKRSEDDVEAEGDDNTYFEDNSDTYAKFDNTIQYRYWREKSGSLAYWSGICDGWSPASIYLPRPARPVTVTGALGHKIIFYPDDLKALGSYLFARTNTPYFATMDYQMAGRKCDPKGTPDQDENGFVSDIRCNDLDPGVWHLALLNRIGKDRLGFVMDVDNNIKINNHPVASYAVSYYNPVTGEDSKLDKAIVELSQVKDAYRVRRSPKAKYLVGVTSKVNFMYYIWPEANRNDSTDSSSKDKLESETYVYDLELDENFNILGGEWGNRTKENGQKVKYAEQPDFIWMAAPQKLPFSEMSPYAIAGTVKDFSNPRPFGNMNWAWDGKSALPEDWMRSAKDDASWKAPATEKWTQLQDGSWELNAEAKDAVLKSAQPLSHIVYYLFDQARNSSQK